MIKSVICVAVWLMLCSQVLSNDIWVLGMGGAKTNQYFITSGLCSYTENSNRQDNEEHTKAAIYIQLSVGRFKDIYANFGIVSPLFDISKRTRPQFSLSYPLGNKIGLPSYIPLDVGAYWAVSPWDVYGFQCSIIKIKL